MANCEDRRKKQVLGTIKIHKIKLDVKHHFHFFAYLNTKKGAYYLQRDSEDENAKLSILD